MEYIYNYTHEDMEANLQIAKAVLISNLLSEGHITTEVHNDYIKNHALIIKKPSFFNAIWKKVIKKDGHEGMRVILVRQLSLIDK